MSDFTTHDAQHQRWQLDLARKLHDAEAQGVCSDCSQPLSRPLNPRRPDVCGRCETAYLRLRGGQHGR